MEQIAARLERLLPAVRRRASDEIASSAAEFREFSGSVEAFHVASGDESIARLEQARRRLLAAAVSRQIGRRPIHLPRYAFEVVASGRAPARRRLRSGGAYTGGAAVVAHGHHGPSRCPAARLVSRSSSV